MKYVNDHSGLHPRLCQVVLGESGGLRVLYNGQWLGHLEKLKEMKVCVYCATVRLCINHYDINQ